MLTTPTFTAQTADTPPSNMATMWIIYTMGICTTPTPSIMMNTAWK